MNMPQETISYNVVHINSLIHSVHSIVPSSSLCHIKAKICSFSKNFVNRFKIQRFSHQVTSKRWLCCSQDSISAENEYCSSRNIAINLLRRYHCFVERGGADNLKEFIIAGVNAFALGCIDEGSRKELTDMKDSGVEIEAMQACGGSTSLKYKIIYQEGFCAVIANAYYMRGMAWLPVKTHQLVRINGSNGQRRRAISNC